LQLIRNQRDPYADSPLLVHCITSFNDTILLCKISTDNKISYFFSLPFSRSSQSRTHDRDSDTKLTHRRLQQVVFYRTRTFSCDLHRLHWTFLENTTMHLLDLYACLLHIYHTSAADMSFIILSWPLPGIHLMFLMNSVRPFTASWHIPTGWSRY
jgi:hypothetical protein